MAPIEGERRGMDQFILEALTRVEAHMAQLEQKVTNLQLEIAQRPAPARPCEFFKEHLEEHKREAQATREFWYQRLGSVFDSIWKPLLILILAAMAIAGDIKVDLKKSNTDTTTTTTTKEVTK